MAGRGREGAGPRLGELVARLRGLLSRLPLLGRLFPQAREGGSAPAEGHFLSEASPGADFAPAPPQKPRLPRLDLSALWAGLLAHPLRLALLGALLLVLLLSGLAALLLAAPPRPPAPPAASTPAGEALAGRLILPPDPALGPPPALEGEAGAVYTREELARLRPLVEADLRNIEASALAEENDGEARALFETVP